MRSTLLLLACLPFLLPAATVRSTPLPDQIVVDPARPQWLVRTNGQPVFICGPGDPEGFLYRGIRNPDGTRSGDQMDLIQTLIGTGANSIYLMAVRSHGGDGDATENPFLDNDPAQGLSAVVLDQWETWFTAMDDAGIVIYFFFYDDSARIWTGNDVGPAEQTFLAGIVNRFEHHRNLIWCVAEEYAEAYSTNRASRIAEEIRLADDNDHVVAVHQNSGINFDFPDDPNVDQFAIQYNVSTAQQLHDGMTSAWTSAAGRYQLTMSESAEHGAGAGARQKSWACVLGGAYVMVLRMDIATTPLSDLEDCGRIVEFMESTNFNLMAPHDELANGATDYVLADPGVEYIAYALDPSGPMGLKGMIAGDYDFRWFDCATGAWVEQLGVSVAAGDQAWTIPPGLGSEVAVSIRYQDPFAVDPSSWSRIKGKYRPGGE